MKIVDKFNNSYLKQYLNELFTGTVRKISSGIAVLLLLFLPFTNNIIEQGCIILIFLSSFIISNYMIFKKNSLLISELKNPKNNNKCDLLFYSDDNPIDHLSISSKVFPDLIDIDTKVAEKNNFINSITPSPIKINPPTIIIDHLQAISPLYYQSKDDYLEEYRVYLQKKNDRIKICNEFREIPFYVRNYSNYFHGILIKIIFPKDITLVSFEDLLSYRDTISSSVIPPPQFDPFRIKMSLPNNILNSLPKTEYFSLNSDRNNDIPFIDLNSNTVEYSLDEMLANTSYDSLEPVGILITEKNFNTTVSLSCEIRAEGLNETLYSSLTLSIIGTD